MKKIDKLISEAESFEQTYKSNRTRNDKIIASRKAKDLILAINVYYKETKDNALMDVMKRLTKIKQKLELRLKGRLTVS